MKNLKIGDVIVICLILALTAGVFCFRFFGMQIGQSAIISVGGQSETYSLNEDRQIEIENNGITLTVVIENGSIFVKESTCHGNDCVHVGKIKNKNETIVCAPAELIVEITGKGADGYDYIIG